MVSFELGKEIKKDVFSSCHKRGTKKKISVPMRTQNFFCKRCKRCLEEVSTKNTIPHVYFHS